MGTLLHVPNRERLLLEENLDKAKTGVSKTMNLSKPLVLKFSHSNCED